MSAEAREQANAFLARVEAWSTTTQSRLDLINPDSDYWNSDERTEAELESRPYDYSEYDEARADLGEDAEMYLDAALATIRELLNEKD